MTRDWNRRLALGGLAAVGLGGAVMAQGAMAMKPDPALVAQLAPLGRLRAAINVGNIVLAQKGGPQGAKGPAVDIANEVGKRLGVPVELLIYDSAGMVVSGLDKDHWDIAFMAIDPVRAAQVGFTAPYVIIEGTYMVRNDAPYHAVSELDQPGRKIATGQGSAYDLYLTRMLKNAALVRSPTSESAIVQFQAENLDAAGGVRQALVQAASAKSGYRVLPDSFQRIEQAVAIPKGREAGLAYVAAVVEAVKASGFVRASLDRAGQADAMVAPPANL